MQTMTPIILAQTPPPAAPAGPAPRPGFDWTFPLLLAGMFAVIYFLILRPQKKKEHERKDMLSKLQKGDKVVTIGGLYGEVVGIKERHVILMVDSERGTTLKFGRSAIHNILAKDSDEAEEK